MKTRPKPSHRVVTLRDVQRGIARGTGGAWMEIALEILGMTERNRSLVDRLVALYGPCCPVTALSFRAVQALAEPKRKKADARPKGTNEVAPATIHATNEKHGGDGASGEVPNHPALGLPDSRQVGQSPFPVDCLQEEGGSGGPQGLHIENGQGTADHTPHGSSPSDWERTEETDPTLTPQASQNTVAQGPALSQLEQKQSLQQASSIESGDAFFPMPKRATSDAGYDVASTSRTLFSEEDEVLSSPKQVGGDSEATPATTASSTRGRRARPSRQARHAYGGQTAHFQHNTDPALIRQARAALEGWLFSGGDEAQSHRWDYPQLAIRLRTQRSPYSARREELGRPALLLLADVSQSCAGFSHEGLAMARAVASLGLSGATVVSIAHSNGEPLECFVNLQNRPDLVPKKQGCFSPEHFVDLYAKLARQFDISHIVALGDYDAVDIYTRLALQPETQGFIWLDNFNCNNQEPARAIPQIEPLKARCAFQYVIGCQNAPDFLKGLQVALQHQRE